LAEKLKGIECDSVISPALGGLFVGHEVGRALDKRHIFAEKEDGKLVEYRKEPARNEWQRVKVKFLSFLPLDKEL
jgi:orotate phosphoribosyltransferase